MVNSQWSIEVTPQSTVNCRQSCGSNRKSKIVNRNFFLLALLFLCAFTLPAQVPQVPHKMQFAGITLTIRDDARKEIQKDVDAMMQSPRHFNIKVERAKTYFPIIEKVFKQEGVPDDFKYLALQESSLIPDAVSVSNAVGFWQFKDFTALEMGMRVDREIDERMNIVSASRGAARYFKKNNTFFNNWIYALQAYQMGAGGVMQAVKNSESGATNMEITSKTYWYVKKYLAHKIAFEGFITGTPQVQVSIIESKGKKSLADLAKEISIDEAALRSNNKWAKSGVVPDDRTYMILIPVSGDINDIKFPSTVSIGNISPIAGAASTLPSASVSILKQDNKINGLPTIIALEGETPTRLAQRASVALPDFLKWNDILLTDPVKAGQVYYLARKRNRATETYHHVMSGENLWGISQKYGVQLKRLQRFNRISGITIKPGETLWLSAKRPKDISTVATNAKTIEVDQQETFTWSDSLNKQPEVLATVPVEPVIVVSMPETPTNTNTDTLKNKQTSFPTEPLQKDSIISITLKKTEHIVQPKETLYAIARLYNIGVMDLVNWNDLNLQQGIKPGQTLKLTDGQQVIQPSNRAVTQEILHEVKPTDTLYSVARKYGVTIKEIMEWNDKKDFNVTIGEKLRILR